jgi:hypothetical protein
MSMRSALAGGTMTVALVAALGNPAAQDAAAEDGASTLLRTVTGVPSWEVPGGAGGDIVAGVVLRLAVLGVLAMGLSAVAGRARARGPAFLAGWGGFVVAGAAAAAAAYTWTVAVVLPGGTLGDIGQDGLVAAADAGAGFGLWTGWLVGLAVAVATRPERSDTFDELAAGSPGRGRVTGPPEPWWAPTATVDEAGHTAMRPGPTVFPPGGMPPVAAGTDETAPVPTRADETAPVAARADETAPVPTRADETAPVPTRADETAPVATPSGQPPTDPDPDATGVMPDATSDPTTRFPA